MAYELWLLWHTNPDVYAIWAVFIGGGGGLQYIHWKPSATSSRNFGWKLSHHVICQKCLFQNLKDRGFAKGWFPKSYFASSPENSCGVFLWTCLGILHWKMALILVIFFWSPFPQKLLKKFGENSEKISGQNSGRKFEKFGELSFCNLSDLT